MQRRLSPVGFGGIQLTASLAARRLILLAALVATAAPVCAEQQRVATLDVPQGEVVEAKAYPWQAIGKLNNGVGGACTAVLISKDYALTAAHCVFFKNTGRYLPAQSFHLVLGYENQQFRDHLRIAAYYVPPGYEPQRPYETLANDWALLAIEKEATAHPLFMSQIGNTGQTSLMTGGYSHLTPYAMTADRDCRFIGRSRDKKFLFDTCRAPAGYSGSPVLVAGSDKRSFFVAGIHVANQVWRAKAVAIAIPIEVIWRTIKPCVEAHDCHWQAVATGRDPTAAELLSGLGTLGHKDVAEFTSSPLCATHDPSCKTSLTGP